ncbi:MAG: hypothetical protein E7597_05500 [Ruminococcaceae bacterium]|nr:hypothetical protein [Oscillospiraceae bacterium]
MKRIAAGLLALAFCLGFIACNSRLIITKDVLTGTWVTPVESQNLNRYNEYTFNEDGTGSYRIYQDGEASERLDFSYKLEDDVLTFSKDGEDTVYNTEYDGTTLKLMRNEEEISLTKENK